MNAPSSKTQYFRISSALKDIVGRELITDDFVAIFELVKNSFDALATRVDLIFEDDKIFIIDNGKGMSDDEIFEKWLFLGYSAKSDGKEEETFSRLDSQVSEDFRNRIQNHKRGFAGNKGIGRFSCDRLGTDLRLYTRSIGAEEKPISCLVISWEKFEADASKEFVKIPVTSTSVQNYQWEVPEKHTLTHGTALEISGCRSVWTRKKLLDLKASLAKLINPFGVKDDLEIYIHSKSDLAKDEENKKSKETEASLLELIDNHFDDRDTAQKHLPTHYLDIVNGRVQNFVFQKIANYTTYVNVSLDGDGTHINSQLFDRGELILEFKEPNPYKNIAKIDIDIEIHFLNRAAKTVFTKTMGLKVVNFGSIFLFNNGFRVFPIGEPGEDTFGLDRRKTQGHARFLGSRDVVGRINLESGNSRKFREASSRNAGFIRTPAYQDLETFLLEKCIKLLERYVVNVSWADKLDKDHLDLDRMKTDSAKARIIDVVAKLVRNKNIELISYSPNLLSIIDEKSKDFDTALSGLEIVASKLGDKTLLSELSVAKNRHAELVESQRKAKEEAEKERQARKEAEEKAAKAEKERVAAEAQAKSAEKRAEDVEKRLNFFTALETEDYESLVEYHHQIGVYSSEISNHLDLSKRKITKFGKLDLTDTKLLMERVEFANAKIRSIVNFATKANFVLDGETIEADLSTFVPQYIEKICAAFAGTGLELSMEGEAKPFELEFKPIELSIVIDNLVHNSRKAGAKKVWFTITTPEKNHFRLSVRDNGKGLSSSIETPSSIFEKGVTTTSGSGLGLYYSRQIISEMGGNIELIVNDDRSLIFNIDFAQ